MKLTEKEQQAVWQFSIATHKQFGDEIRDIRLFGSKARGNSGPESDIDVLVVTRRDDWRLKEDIGHIATTILLDKGVYLSVKVFGGALYGRLVKFQTPFIKNVLKEGVAV